MRAWHRVVFIDLVDGCPAGWARGVLDVGTYLTHPLPTQPDSRRAGFDTMRVWRGEERYEVPGQVGSRAEEVSDSLDEPLDPTCPGT